MTNAHTTIQRYRDAATLSLAEIIWPTRCAICDMPGVSLCENCALELSYIDWWRACERCGSPNGYVQCCDCNGASLEFLGRVKPGYDQCASAVEFDDRSARIIRTWKDAGQRSLAADIASIMAPYAHPIWLATRPVVVPVPASKAAKRRRGFDHGVDLAAEIASALNLSIAELLLPPNSKDQRELGRRDRIKNMDKRFSTTHDAARHRSVILTDDVHTTGSTLYAAADALHEAGVINVWSLTFARA